ncbi:MAG: nitroreductase family protein [Thermoplasmata archaeon]|nr:nitroreductase family protein [Thermoplasmata archaeon]
MSGDLHELMKNRRTVRNFLPDPVDEESLNKILEAVTLPPSGAGLLPYGTVVVRDPEMKQKIRDDAQKVEIEYYERLTGRLKDKFDKMGVNSEKPFLTDAPVLLIIAGDTEKPYWLESTWLAIGYIVLAIENEGLGSVTYTPSDFSFIMDLLKIPDRFVPQVILPVGYPANKKPPKKSRPEGRIYYEECKE